MNPYRIILVLCQILFVVFCEDSQCGFEGRMLICGNNTSCQKIKIKNGVYQLATDSISIKGLLYDVHAVKLCQNYDVGDLTLADAIQQDSLCQGRTTATMAYIVEFEFGHCREIFEHNSNEGLVVYAYNNPECTGNLSYRFLLVNNSSEFL